MIQNKVTNLIESVKKEYRLTDEELGTSIGLTGPSFRERRVRGNLNLWQLEHMIKEYGITNEEILALFGRKTEPLEKRLFDELKKINSEIGEIKAVTEKAISNER